MRDSQRGRYLEREQIYKDPNPGFCLVLISYSSLLCFCWYPRDGQKQLELGLKTSSVCKGCSSPAEFSAASSLSVHLLWPWLHFPVSPMTLLPIPMCGFFPHITGQFTDSGCVFYNSIQFWHYLLRDISHRLRAKFPKTIPTTEVNGKSRLLPVFLPNWLPMTPSFPLVLLIN